MKHRHDVAWVRLFGRERPGDWTDRTPHAARRTPARACRRHLILAPSASPAPPSPRLPPHPATSMWQRRRWDAPVNNLMVRSQSACSFQGAGIAGSRWGPAGWPRFPGFSMIARRRLFYLIGQNPSWSWSACSRAIPGSHIRLRRLIFPAFRVPSKLIGLSWAVTPGIAGVTAHGNRGR